MTKLSKHLLVGSLLLLCIFSIDTKKSEASNPIPLYPIQAHGEWGYIDNHGNVRIPPRWAMAWSFTDNVAQVQDDDDAYYLIDRNGSIVLGPMPSIDRNTLSYTIIDEYGRRGVYDIQRGKYIVSDLGNIYDSHSTDLASTRLLVINPDETRYGYLDRNTGNLAIPMDFDVMPHDSSLSTFFDKMSSDYSLATFNEGYAIVEKSHPATKNIASYLIDENGVPVSFPEDIIPITPPRAGVLIIGKFFPNENPSLSYMLRGIGNVNGEVLLYPKYADHRSFQSDGYAAMFYKHEDSFDYDITFVNRQGEELIAPVPFIAHERATPELIDGYFCLVSDATDSTILYHVAHGKLLHMADTRIGYISPAEGIMLSAPWSKPRLLTIDGEFIAEFKEMNPFFYFDSTEGAPWISDLQQIFHYKPGKIIDDLYFSDGLQAASIVTDTGIEKWGFIRSDGSFAAPPRWEFASNFCDGLALVYQHGSMAYINHAGEVIWPSLSSMTSHGRQNKLSDL